MTASMYNVSFLLHMGDIVGDGSAMSAEIRVSAKAVPTMINVATLGGGGTPGNRDLAEAILIQCNLNQGLKRIEEQGTKVAET